MKKKKKKGQKTNLLKFMDKKKKFMHNKDENNILT